MKKVFLAMCLAAISSVGAFAQTDDYKKGEVFVGFSNNQVDTGFSDNDNDLREFFDKRESFNGFNVSATGNVSRYFGIKGDVSGHYKGYELDVPRPGTVNTTDRFKVDASVYNFLGGVQVKDNAKDGSRVRPFGHALVGAAHARAKVDNSFFTSGFCTQPGVDCRNDLGESETGFAAAIGGGIDFRATNRLSIRAIQVDYNPNRFSGTTQHNVRFGFGLVFH